MISSREDWLVVVNPNAGRKKGLADWGIISGLLVTYGIPYESVFTERPGHATEIVIRKVDSDGFKRIIAVGGDGTMNEVVNGIFGQARFGTTDITLGMITVGTGNDWGRMFGIPSDYEEAVKILKADRTFIQDAGMVRFCNENRPGNRYFVNIAGMGFDAVVTRKSNLQKEKGRSGFLLYFVNILTSLLNYRFAEVYINLDGVHLQNKIFSMNVGICRYSGGGMIQAPNAIPDDGLFDLTIINKLSKPRVILSLKRLYNGTIHLHPRVDSYTAKTIRIRSRDVLMLETDGESLGHTPVEFSMVPRSVRVLTG